MMKRDEETTSYAKMGVAALLPGMNFMLEKMQQQIDEMKTMLGILQEQPTVLEGKRSVGRPRKIKSSWSDDPEERKLEMQRRMKIREQKRVAHIPVSSKAHPDHAKWIEKITRQRKREWAALSPQKRRERLARMEAGRAKQRAAAKKPKKPLVKLQVKANQEVAA
jgi:hypothetical protein